MSVLGQVGLNQVHAGLNQAQVGLAKRFLLKNSGLVRILELRVLIVIDTVELGDKERFDKEQIGVEELFTDYQTFYTINLLLDKELLPI